MRPRPLYVVVLVVVFLALRIALLVVREPFFDELFTVWISRKSFAGIVEALRFDSGPPLYYFLVRLLGLQSVVAARLMSLVFAGAGFAALLGAREYLAAAFVAVFPPSVLFAVDARSYALCAMFLTIAVLAIDRKKPWFACVALVLAAYSHYYAVLFFPLLWRYWRAVLVTVIAFVPGFCLAFHQPAQARAWITLRWPDALFWRPPVAALIVLVALIVFCVRSVRAYVPLVLALLARVYVPMRFESVLAPLLGADARWRKGAGEGLVAACLCISILGIVDHSQRPPDDYQLAADWLTRNFRNERVVATGYLYLPTIVKRQAEAFPAEQAIHPGWRALPKPGEPPPQPPFIWIGERQAPELRMLGKVEPLYVNDRAMVARIR